VRCRFSFIASLVYASVVFHRYRKGKRRGSRLLPITITHTQDSPTLTTNSNSNSQPLHPISRDIPTPSSQDPTSLNNNNTPHQTRTAPLPIHLFPHSPHFTIPEHQISEIDGKERPHTAAIDTDALMALPVRPLVPPYFERLSRIGRGRGNGEVFELEGRRGGIAIC
jgi:hypothetical protein